MFDDDEVETNRQKINQVQGRQEKRRGGFEGCKMREKTILHDPTQRFITLHISPP
jgi:hypothetical protein